MKPAPENVVEERVGQVFGVTGRIALAIARVIGRSLARGTRRGLIALLTAGEEERLIVVAPPALSGAKGGASATAPSAAPRKRGRPPKVRPAEESQVAAVKEALDAVDAKHEQQRAGPREAQLAALARGRETRARNVAARRQEQ